MPVLKKFFIIFFVDFYSFFAFFEKNRPEKR